MKEINLIFIKFVAMRLLIYFVCIIFTFVSLGGNIYLHQCKEATMLSLYDQIDTESCPFCAKHHKSADDKDEHCAGECKDSVLDIEQLTDKNFNTQQVSFVQFSPAITPLLWIVNFIIPVQDYNKQQQTELFYSCTDSSPPIYIQNQIFRI